MSYRGHLGAAQFAIVVTPALVSWFGMSCIARVLWDFLDMVIWFFSLFDHWAKYKCKKNPTLLEKSSVPSTPYTKVCWHFKSVIVGEKTTADWVKKKKKKRKKKIILMSVKYWINGKCLTRLFFKKWRVYCTPSHTLGRVLSLVSMYSCFIRSSKFHLLFFLYSFMIRKVACSAGKCFYILLLIPFLLFVSFRFVSFPSLFLRTTSGFFLIIKILPKPIFVSHKWIFKLYIDVNRCSFVTLILLK